MNKLRLRVEVATLQAILTILAVSMKLASRNVKRFRRQISRDLIVELRSDDGAGLQYKMEAKTRRLTYAASHLTPPDCALVFPSARVGLRTLLSRYTVGRIVEGMTIGNIRIEGNPALILWFHGLTRIVAPIGSTRRPRRPAPVPIRSPEHDAPYARRIICEPPVSELSRDWPQAWAARAKLLQVRAAEGERLPPG